MPQPSRSRILTHAGGTAASIGLGMIPLHRLPQPVRTGYVVLPAVFTSGLLLIAQQRNAPGSAVAERGAENGAGEEPSRGPRMPTASECALSLAVGGVVAGVGAAGIRVDRGIENLLRRRGVPAPRLMMGLASGAFMLALNVLEARAPAPDNDPSLERRVLELLTEADPMELTPGRPDGTPAEEYRPEAAAIATILQDDGAITAAQLGEVWQHWFSESLSSSLEPESVTALVTALNGLASASAD